MRQPSGGSSTVRVLTVVGLLVAAGMDLAVLRPTWVRPQIEPGQLLRGYFERLGGEIGIAADPSINPGMVPRFHLAASGELSIPPGMVAVLELVPGVTYALQSRSSRPALAVVGDSLSGLPPPPGGVALPGERRLAAAHVPAAEGKRFSLRPWQAEVPWKEEARRLDDLAEACGVSGLLTQEFEVLRDGQLRASLGQCRGEIPSPPPEVAPRLLAAVAGPDWLSVRRSPTWETRLRFEWVVPVLVAVKSLSLAWGLGLVSAVAASLVLGVAAVWWPDPSLLVWPGLLALGLIASVGRMVWIVGQWLGGWRTILVAVVLAGVGVVAGLRGGMAPDEPAGVEFQRESPGDGEPVACRLIGYSTVKGEGLRQERGGIRSIVNESCEPCRHRTGSRFAGGESLRWAEESLCAARAGESRGGVVALLAGTNDDFFWAATGLPRLLLGNEAGPDSWDRGVIAAAEGTLAVIERQEASLRRAIQCATREGARFVFLHDLLVTDLKGGRDAVRQALLDHRRRVVEEQGQVFVDLWQEMDGTAGVWWFNDYVHPSVPGHEEIAARLCATVQGAGRARPDSGGSSSRE